MATYEEIIEEATQEFIKNPYWRGELENAPSETYKLHCKLSFTVAEFGGHDGLTMDFIEMSRKLEEQFTLEDWKYYRKYCGHNPIYTRCTKMIEKLSKQENQQQSEI